MDEEERETCVLERGKDLLEFVLPDKEFLLLSPNGIVPFGTTDNANKRKSNQQKKQREDLNCCRPTVVLFA